MDPAGVVGSRGVPVSAEPGDPVLPDVAGVCVCPGDTSGESPVSGCHHL